MTAWKARKHAGDKKNLTQNKRASLKFEMRSKFQKFSTNQPVKIKIPNFRNKLFVSIIENWSVQNFKKSVDNARKNCLYGANICESNFFCHPRGKVSLNSFFIDCMYIRMLNYRLNRKEHLQ